MKLCYRWNAVKYLTIQNTSYLLLYNQINADNVYFCKIENKKVYLVATDDPDVSIFFVQSDYTPETEFPTYVERIL